MNFTKLHGLGNDYIYINLIDEKNQLDEKKIGKICRYITNRNFGVGADGIILIEKSKVADFKMRIYNQDGSQAEMCGNGIRGFAKYVYDNKLINNKEMTIETLAGIKKVRVYTMQDGKVQTVQVNMGKASLEKNKDIITNDENIPIMLKYEIEGKIFTGTYISIGNPHFVIFERTIDNLNLEKIGRIIENDKHFPNRVNVEVAQIMDKSNIKMRVWERGSGETFSCGTGACATAKISNFYGFTRDIVKVHLKGGALDVRLNKQTDEIYLAGISSKVFDGSIVNEIVGII